MLLYEAEACPACMSEIEMGLSTHININQFPDDDDGEGDDDDDDDGEGDDDNGDDGEGDGPDVAVPVNRITPQLSCPSIAPE